MLANLVPLYGVLFRGWEAFPLLVLFWAENVVIGVLNVARMLCLNPADPALWAAKLGMAGFFCVHYGMFTAGHGVFVLSGLFGSQHYKVDGLDVRGPALAAIRDFDLWLPLGVLATSHLFSFLWNYLYRGEVRSAQLQELMMKPYARVVVLHVTILIGGIAAAALGSPLWMLLLLVGLKIFIDLAAHLKEHRA